MWQRQGERFHSAVKVEYGCGLVMVWGGALAGMDTPTSVFLMPKWGPVLAQSATASCSGMIMSVLTSQHCLGVPRIQGIKLMEWPACSQDLNPTKHLNQESERTWCNASPKM